MKKQFTTAIIALAVLFTTSQASAGSENNSYIDTAKVLDVEPIYETVSISIPEERCWKKPHRHNRHRSSHNDSYTGTIAGGIIGGVVGNQFGHGRGKDAMTVAGTLLGLSIGRDLSHNTSWASDNRGFNRKHRKRKQLCETSNRYESRQEIVGYRVKYRYKGNKFWTRTQSHPGKHIKIRVKIKPLHDDYY